MPSVHQLLFPVFLFLALATAAVITEPRFRAKADGSLMDPVLSAPSSLQAEVRIEFNYVVPSDNTNRLQSTIVNVPLSDRQKVLPDGQPLPDSKPQTGHVFFAPVSVQSARVLSVKGKKRDGTSLTEENVNCRVLTTMLKMARIGRLLPFGFEQDVDVASGEGDAAADTKMVGNIRGLFCFEGPLMLAHDNSEYVKSVT